MGIMFLRTYALNEISKGELLKTECFFPETEAGLEEILNKLRHKVKRFDQWLRAFEEINS
jgi:hypothetical protein